jgi:hypothetical protein
MAEILPFHWYLEEAPDCLDIPPPPSETRKQARVPAGWDFVDTSTETEG